MAQDRPSRTLSKLRSQLMQELDDAELDAFCLDYFPKVYDKFGRGMRHDEKVTILLDHVRRDPEALSRLVALLASRSHPQEGAEAVAAYLEVVRAQCERMETRPYHQLYELRGASPCLAMLDDADREGLYIPLRFDLHASRALERTQVSLRPAAQDEGAVERELSRVDIDLSEVLAVPGHAVFLGGAGCGKTTVLRWMATLLATGDPDRIHAELGLADGALPVFVALRDFDYACQSRPADYTRDVAGFLRFLDDHFERWHPERVPYGFISGLVRAGRVWLLLDALDEVADFDRRIAMRQVIELLAGEFPGNRLLVTARVAAYAHANSRLDERFNLVTVRKLVREQWVTLMERLYAGMETRADVGAERARRLVARVDASPLLQEMVKTPLMVWTATLIHYADRELPEQRAELYAAYVDVLLGERLHEEESAEAAQSLRDDRWPLDDRRLYLSYAAYRTHEQAAQAGHDRDTVVVVDEEELVRRILAPFMQDYLRMERQRDAEREAAAFVALMAERSGLLHPQAEGYSFGDHLTVQEFLTAAYLVENVRHKEGWLDFLRERAGQSWWHEVFLLMAGMLLRTPRQANSFLLDELGRIPGGGDPTAYALAWAGEALLEIAPRRVGWHAGAREQLARRMVTALWESPPTTSVAARVSLGEVLGRLGDPRFQGALCLPEFVPLPGGTFWMGSDEGEIAELVKEIGKEWFKREAPRHQVRVDAFALARYPTTNAMYARFLEDGGYADPRWWAEAETAQVWRPDGTVKDWFGDARDRPRYWEDGRFNGPNQPVVGVTWYEAAAYCRWLTATLNDGACYRLPTEAEWEYAARGPRGWRYPWGDSWGDGLANTKVLGLERTTPVGVFPDGATPEGLLDMAGNIWEWCSDWFGEETYGEGISRVVENPGGSVEGEFKILRGGSWYHEPALARCGCRRRGIPDDWNDDDGFRVARGSLP